MICSKSTLHDSTEPMKLFLVPTVVFVGCIIWKNKSGWFLLFPGAVSGHRKSADCWGPLLIFNTYDLLKINHAPHHRANETLSCPYNGVCLIHMEE
jgi:hypothetical protein